jgi:hypothetical protein
MKGTGAGFVLTRVKWRINKKMEYGQTAYNRTVSARR